MNSEGYEGAAPLDPLGYGEPLPLEVLFFPLGFPVVLRTNSPHVVEAAREGWEGTQQEFENPPVELRVIVRPSSAENSPDSLGDPVFRGQGNLLLFLWAKDNFAVCDLDRTFCFACLSPAVAQNHEFTRYHFLDGMAYCCLDQHYLTPLHASCVTLDGKGILLVGGPGAGKSSLAWACARAGLTFLADDGMHLLRNCQEPMLIGKPERARFRPEAIQLFPELAGLPRFETLDSERAFEIRTSDVPGLACATRCQPWKIIFLDRRKSGPAAFSRVEGAEMRRRLSQNLAMRERWVWEEWEASIHQLASFEALELRYSSLADAVAQIFKLA
ncbi:MAG: hypothetical protein HY236_00795 [Acidobacteria bacterium]|nr:hypothetical protein [Acidobacteriota bacterium]